MARTFASASSQYLIYLDAAVVASAPLTVSAFFMTSTTGTNKSIFTIGDTATNNAFRLVLSSTDAVRAQANQGGVAGNADTSATISTGSWQHACGVFASSTSRAAYLNGTNKGTNATDLTPTGLDTTLIGSLYATGVTGSYMNGDLAEVAVWNLALSDAEVATLALGVSPLMVRPENIVSYWPIMGRYSPEIDIVGGANMDLTNNPVFATHPRVFKIPAQQCGPAA